MDDQDKNQEEQLQNKTVNLVSTIDELATIDQPNDQTIQFYGNLESQKSEKMAQENTDLAIQSDDINSRNTYKLPVISNSAAIQKENGNVEYQLPEQTSSKVVKNKKTLVIEDASNLDIQSSAQNNPNGSISTNEQVFQKKQGGDKMNGENIKGDEPQLLSNRSKGKKNKRKTVLPNIDQDLVGIKKAKLRKTIKIEKSPVKTHQEQEVEIISLNSPRQMQNDYQAQQKDRSKTLMEKFKKGAQQMRDENKKDVKETKFANNPDQLQQTLRDMVLHKPQRESTSRNQSESPMRRTLVASFIARKSSDARNDILGPKNGTSPGDDGNELNDEMDQHAVNIFHSNQKADYQSYKIKSKKFTQNLGHELKDLGEDLPDITHDKQMVQTTRIKRMRYRDNRKLFLIYPEDKGKQNWDILMAGLLLFTCMVTPYRIAFSKDDILWTCINYTVDFLFLCDIIVIFFTSFYDEEFVIHEGRWDIARTYIRSGWFFVDVLAIFPFTWFGGELDSGDTNEALSPQENAETSAQANELARIARLGRMYKLIKLTKLIRVIRIVKEKNKILRYATDILNLGQGFERLFFFIIMSFMVCHIVACLWVFFASFADELKGTWMDNDDIRGMNTDGRYLTSMYWTVTTITTVGYGDISASNNIERIFCIITMMAGVVLFNTAASIFTKLLQTYDTTNANFQEKVVILNRIYKDFFMPLKLYERVKKSLRYKQKKDIEDLAEFLEDLPQGLRLEVSLFVHESTYRKIIFLKERSSSFIAWICPLLKPQLNSEDQYVYFEGDEICNVYFLKEGECGLVLPRYNNIKYVSYNVGCHFGFIDILGSVYKHEIPLDEWQSHSDKLKRQFTVMSQTQCELLTLSLQDLERMRCEFSEAYSVLFLGLYERLRNSHKIKIWSISHCNDNLEQPNYDDENDDSAKMRFTSTQLKPGFRIEPVDLREIDDGGSMFESSSSSSDSMDQEASYSGSGKEDGLKNKEGNSIDIIQERDSEYSQKEQNDQSPQKNKTPIKNGTTQVQKSNTKIKQTSAQKRNDRIFNRDVKEKDLNIKKLVSSDGQNSISEMDKSAENIILRVNSLSSSAHTGLEDKNHDDISKNAAYQRYHLQNKKQGMDDDEAVQTSNAMLEKLEGVLKSKVQNNLMQGTSANPADQSSSTLLSTLHRPKQQLGKRGSITVPVNPFGLTVGQGLTDKSDCSDFQLQQPMPEDNKLMQDQIQQMMDQMSTLIRMQVGQQEQENRLTEQMLLMKQETLKIKSEITDLHSFIASKQNNQ